MTDEVPKNALYDKRKQVLSSLTAAYNPNELASIIIANLSDYYIVPPDKTAIVKYIYDHVTIEEAIDPFFISQLVIDLRRSNTADLKSTFLGNPKNQIKRHFVHRVAMTQELDGWKILAIESSYIANYIPVY